VLAEPLPLDGLGIELTRPEYWCPACLAVHDTTTGDLVAVTMPVGSSLPFTVRASREGASVGLADWTLASTAEGIAYPSAGCRPRALDANCDVFSPVWLTALAPGTATGSVTARNLTARLDVRVTGTSADGSD
jgi:hypothetical protein